MAREYTQKELTAWFDVEGTLAAKGLVCYEQDGKTDMDWNANTIIKYFEANPTIEMSVRSITEAVELLRDQLKWLSKAEMEYNRVYRALSKTDQDQFGAWWFTSGKKYVETDGDHGFENATKIILWAKGRSFTPATFDLAVSNLVSSQGLHLAQSPRPVDPRQHQDSGAFMPKSQTNISARDAARARQAGAKPTPAPAQSNEPDAWKTLCEQLTRHGSHSCQENMRRVFEAKGEKSWRELYKDLERVKKSYEHLFSCRY